MLNVIPIIVFFGLIIFAVLVSAVVRRLSGWNRVYTIVAKRYAGQVSPGYLMSRPSMSFNYGQTACRVGTRKTFRFGDGKSTELVLNWPDKHWPDRKFNIEISTNPPKAPRKWNLKRADELIEFEESPLKGKLYISSNRPDVARRLLTPAVQWQIEQLRRHLGNEQLHITINKGKLSISKPTYIKKLHLFDDFVRFGLELYDQMALTDCKGIEFLSSDDPVVIEDVTCPICSEAIEVEVVVCVRCKTPHCLDCWQYNGQCATFACNETRYLRPGEQTAHA